MVSIIDDIRVVMSQYNVLYASPSATVFDSSKGAAYILYRWLIPHCRQSNCKIHSAIRTEGMYSAGPLQEKGKSIYGS